MSTTTSASGASQPQATRALGAIVVCGCLISLIGFGVRSSYGLFNAPLSEANGWGRDVFALALAFQNILWGLGQPFAGALADRYGPARVLAGGGLLYGLGVALTAYSDAPVLLHLTAGVLVGLGLAGASFTIVIAGFGRHLPPERRSWAAGIATAAGSLGQFLFAPMGQAFIAAYGWQTALVLLGAFFLLVPFLAIPLRGGGGHAAGGGAHADLSMRQALGQAFGHRSYQLLVAGFFVCGFHLAFITVHLPPYLTDVGISPTLAAWALAVIGLANVVGSYSSGILGGRMSKRTMLCFIYFARAVAIALFILLPVTPASVLAFAAAMGLLWLSTVPPTSGLVALMFGTRHLGMLFGMVFLSHQVGAFLGVWLGGILYEAVGNYDLVWWMSVALGIFSAIVHWPIAEREAPHRLSPAAA
ncbi:MFS transporter [Azospirillum halopraeferens]|uniref:MFS transporter n=1 Tax=Azospirillum halopraeferens TaxID=34010 RepID=UPI0004102A09|nr:MFS transporter [Azospirillum halopraeferens]